MSGAIQPNDRTDESDAQQQERERRLEQERERLLAVRVDEMRTMARWLQSRRDPAHRLHSPLILLASLLLIMALLFFSSYSTTDRRSKGTKDISLTCPSLLRHFQAHLLSVSTESMPLALLRGWGPMESALLLMGLFAVLATSASHLLRPYQSLNLALLLTDLLSVCAAVLVVYHLVLVLEVQAPLPSSWSAPLPSSSSSFSSSSSSSSFFLSTSSSPSSTISFSRLDLTALLGDVFSSQSCVLGPAQALSRRGVLPTLTSLAHTVSSMLSADYLHGLLQQQQLQHPPSEDQLQQVELLYTVAAILLTVGTVLYTQRLLSSVLFQDGDAAILGKTLQVSVVLFALYEALLRNGHLDQVLSLSRHLVSDTHHMILYSMMLAVQLILPHLWPLNYLVFLLVPLPVFAFMTSTVWHLRFLAVWLVFLFLPLRHHVTTLIRILYTAVIAAMYTTLGYETLIARFDLLDPQSCGTWFLVVPPLLAALLTVRCRSVHRFEQLFVGGWLLWFLCMLLLDNLQSDQAETLLLHPVCRHLCAHPLLRSVAGVWPASCVVGIVVGVWERLFIVSPSSDSRVEQSTNK
mmetsp:Transcript_40647/g.102316  ORF Transcript_40647/g.102316 Transcript_40647/m.102316 type:complete len:577 (+) Transcript_40647:116-1846(+)